jgi:hypothetical protein
MNTEKYLKERCEEYICIYFYISLEHLIYYEGQKRDYNDSEVPDK